MNSWMDNSQFLTLLFVVLPAIVVVGVLIASIGIGAYFLQDCPVQPYIPVDLIVLGIFVLLSLLVTLCFYYVVYSKDIFRFLGSVIVLIPVCFILYLFDVCWFITGSVWIYSVYPPSYDPKNEQNYCNKTLYLFAFCLNTVCYASLALILLCIVFSGLYSCVKYAFQKPQPLSSSPPQQA